MDIIKIARVERMNERKTQLRGANFDRASYQMVVAFKKILMWNGNLQPTNET